jgi:hypothetical protein
LVRYFFLKRPKTEISENLKFAARMFPRGRLLLAAVGYQVRRALMPQPADLIQKWERTTIR